MPINSKIPIGLVPEPELDAIVDYASQPTKTGREAVLSVRILKLRGHIEAAKNESIDRQIAIFEETLAQSALAAEGKGPTPTLASVLARLEGAELQPTEREKRLVDAGIAEANRSEDRENFQTQIQKLENAVQWWFTKFGTFADRLGTKSILHNEAEHAQVPEAVLLLEVVSRAENSKEENDGPN